MDVSIHDLREFGVGCGRDGLMLKLLMVKNLLVSSLEHALILRSCVTKRKT